MGSIVERAHEMADKLQQRFDALLDRVIGPLLEGEGAEISVEAREGRGPLVQDDMLADKMVRKMAHLERDILERMAHVAIRQAECAEEVQEELAPVIRWQADEDAKARRSLMALEGLLRGYLTHLRDMGKLGTAKGYALPAGRLQFSDVAEDFEIMDEAAFITWGKPLGFVEMVPKVRWIRARRWLHAAANVVGARVYVDYLDPESGEWIQEIVPGVRVTRPQGESFRVQHAKKVEVQHD
jgi:hypothetical protein